MFTAQIIDKYIIKYLPTFPIDTKIKKGTKENLSVPATNVIGSPINGTQDNNKDHLPYLLKILVPFAMLSCLMGNQGFLVK